MGRAWCRDYSRVMFSVQVSVPKIVWDTRFISTPWLPTLKWFSHNRHDRLACHRKNWLVGKLGELKWDKVPIMFACPSLTVRTWWLLRVLTICTVRTRRQGRWSSGATVGYLSCLHSNATTRYVIVVSVTSTSTGQGTIVFKVNHWRGIHLFGWFIYWVPRPHWNKYGKTYTLVFSTEYPHTER